MIFLSVKNYVSNHKSWYGDIPFQIICENADTATKKVFFSKKEIKKTNVY
jgi:hypothetical protein